jgi:hypothetical protein
MENWIPYCSDICGLNYESHVQPKPAGSHVQSLCDALDIPHLEARIDIDNGYKEQMKHI